MEERPDPRLIGVGFDVDDGFAFGEGTAAVGLGCSTFLTVDDDSTVTSSSRSKSGRSSVFVGWGASFRRRRFAAESSSKLFGA